MVAEGPVKISFFLRVRLFHLKIISGNHFTPCHVFGCAWKFWSNRKSFSLTVKCAWLKCKIDYKSILPSNQFRKKKKKAPNQERERKRGHHRRKEREKESEREPPTVRERKAGHLNLRSTAPPSRLCLSPPIKQRSTPPLPHHRSTNTQDPPLWSSAMHRWVQVELWS